MTSLSFLKQILQDVRHQKVRTLLTLFGSVPVVFGHIGAVMLICRSGALPWLTRRLAAAGRMAMSCYLFDSVACTQSATLRLTISTGTLRANW